jgi:hypothetical protein
MHNLTNLPIPHNKEGVALVKEQQKKISIFFGSMGQNRVKGHAKSPHKRSMRALHHAGFQVVIFDETRTSLVSPCDCNAKAVPFAKVERKKPDGEIVQVETKAVLKCSSCGQIYGRDIMACLNGLKIVQSIIAGNGRPDIYRKGQQFSAGIPPTQEELVKEVEQDEEATIAFLEQQMDEESKKNKKTKQTKKETKSTSKKKKKQKLEEVEKTTTTTTKRQKQEEEEEQEEPAAPPVYLIPARASRTSFKRSGVRKTRSNADPVDLQIEQATSKLNFYKTRKHFCNIGDETELKQSVEEFESHKKQVNTERKRRRKENYRGFVPQEKPRKDKQRNYKPWKPFRERQPQPQTVYVEPPNRLQVIIPEFKSVRLQQQREAKAKAKQAQSGKS